MFEIKPDKNEILRYLGHNGQKVDDSIYTLIDECIDEIRSIARFRYTYKIFDVRIGVSQGSLCIELSDTNVKLTGNDIYEHLRDCRKCAVMAVTLGVEVDNIIRTAQRDDMLKALVLDSCATEFIEKLCDNVENEIQAIAQSENKGINFRFSPGYGDLPIDVQSSVVRILDGTRKIGLTVTENSLMIPGKSVTAIIGFTTDYKLKPGKTGCDICSMRNNCMFRRGGTTCARGRVYKA